MSKQEIFEELKSLHAYFLIEYPDGGVTLDRLQELIWKVGEELGEF